MREVRKRVMMSGVKIVLDDVRKRYGSGNTSVDALRGVSLFVEEGEFVAVVGPSGSGKSTLLHLIGALDTLTSGSITVGDVELSRMDEVSAARFRNEMVGFVFQNYYLQTHLTSVENVELPLLIRGVSSERRRKRAEEVLDAVGLGGRMWHRPNQLSGGECQRVAIARAIVTRPELLLADEPTGNLDTSKGMEVMRLIARLNEEFGMTTLVVTHNDSVAALAERRVYLRDGEVVRDERA